ncbi:hypothetical protein IFR05_011898 [Cadophora sp. M221]|nr:hypothetical protein IFR05_011898 [Cadophora sp. M221]
MCPSIGCGTVKVGPITTIIVVFTSLAHLRQMIPSDPMSLDSMLYSTNNAFHPVSLSGTGDGSPGREAQRVSSPKATQHMQPPVASCKHLYLSATTLQPPYMIPNKYTMVVYLSTELIPFHVPFSWGYSQRTGHEPGHGHWHFPRVAAAEKARGRGMYYAVM